MILWYYLFINMFIFTALSYFGIFFWLIPRAIAGQRLVLMGHKAAHKLLRSSIVLEVHKWICFVAVGNQRCESFVWNNEEKTIQVVWQKSINWSTANKSTPYIILHSRYISNYRTQHCVFETCGVFMCLIQIVSIWSTLSGQVPSPVLPAVQPSGPLVISIPPGASYQLTHPELEYAVPFFGGKASFNKAILTTTDQQGPHQRFFVSQFWYILIVRRQTSLIANMILLAIINYHQANCNWVWRWSIIHLTRL